VSVARRKSYNSIRNIEVGGGLICEEVDYSRIPQRKGAENPMKSCRKGLDGGNHVALYVRKNVLEKLPGEERTNPGE